MNIYHLHRADPIGYDQARAMVVIADSATDARRLAAQHCWDEGPEVWQELRATATQLGWALRVETPRVVSSDIREG